MEKISFEDYLSDMLDLHIGLLSDTELNECRESYKNYISTPVRAEHTKINAKAQTGRNTAKTLGGKALRGTLKQKQWAETIRAEKLEQMDYIKATELLSYDGFITNAKFWIENRNISADKFDVALIKKEVEEIITVEAKNWDVLARTGNVCDKEKAKKEIESVRKECVFVYTEDISRLTKKVTKKNEKTIIEQFAKKVKVNGLWPCGLTVEQAASVMLNDKRHPATEKDSVEFKGITARVFSIPTLDKDCVVLEHDGKVFRGYTK